MLVKVQKWGNGPGVRIPKALAEEAGLEVGIEVELLAEDGELRITTWRSKRYDLDECWRAYRMISMMGNGTPGLRSAKKSGSDS